MSDRIISCICPHCQKSTDVFIMIGQTAFDYCEKCGKIIIFNKYGKIEDRKLTFLEKVLLEE